MIKNEKMMSQAVGFLGVLVIFAGIGLLIKAGVDSDYFEPTTEALATAAAAKWWAINGGACIAAGIVLVIVSSRSRK